ncbi:MAG: hydrogenase maturation nickel metallochaperone HypA/HybF [Planctomycetota bacterium]|jgi:hydrogenase nickel incorporation protein HypA/HybF
MHETVVAQNILAAIIAEAKKQNAKPLSAKISCGMLYALNDDLLDFAFEAITKTTPYEGMKLIIEHKPLMGHCNSCQKDFEADFSIAECTHCGSDRFELLPDGPLLLEEIEFE